MLGRRCPNGPRFPWRVCDIIFCHVSWIFFSDNLNDLTRDTVSKMLNANMLYCLFTVTLNVCYVQPQCTATETCWVRNIRGTSTNFSLAQRPPMYPGSCMWMCSLRSECTATTYYPIGDICELHEYVTEGTSCILLTDNVGFSLWMRKVPGRPCPKVRYKGPFYQLRLTLNPAWISNNIHYNVWDGKGLVCLTSDLRWVTLVTYNIEHYVDYRLSPHHELFCKGSSVNCFVPLEISVYP